MCNGHSSLNGGTIFVSETNNQSLISGRGIYTNGFLTLISSEIKHNQAGYQGGGIWSAKGLTSKDSKIFCNNVIILSLSSGGGGLFIDDGNCILDETNVTFNKVYYDTNRSMGGGISVMSGSIYVQNNSHTENLNATTQQAQQSGGSGGSKLIQLIPEILNKFSILNNDLVNSAIEQITTNNLIAGGGIASFLTAPIIIEDSKVTNNFAGKFESASNAPFQAIGGGIFSFKSQINLQNSIISCNRSLSSGGGIWTNTGLNSSKSKIINNCIECEGDGGGLFNGKNSESTLINTEIVCNVSKRNGGGIENQNLLSLISSIIKNNKSCFI